MIDIDFREKRLTSLMKSVRLIDPAIRKREALLMTRKWFEYRFMSPLEATTRFAELYVEAYQAHYRKNYDVEVATRVRGVSQELPAGPDREYTQLWVARQRADKFGLEYSSYLEFCFRFAGRRTRNQPPRPNQLHGSGSTAVAWTAEFEKSVLDRQGHDLDRMPAMKQYRMEAFIGLPAQVAFRAYVVADASARTRSWSRTIGNWSLSRRVVPIEDFRAAMPKGHFADAGRSALADSAVHLSTREPWADLNPAELWQSCFGVPGAYRTEGAPCSVCPQHSACREMSAMTLRQLVKIDGTSDHWLEKRRASGRVRTANSRAKEKLDRARSPIPGATHD